MALPSRKRFFDYNYPTSSSEDQEDVEESVFDVYDKFRKSKSEEAVVHQPKLQRAKHLAYLLVGLKHLSQSYQCLDASRPWLCFWILHSLELLDYRLTEDQISEIANFLGKCQHPDGGFGGGPGQYAHLAPTYAAICALSIMGTDQAYQVINREKLQNFLMRVRTNSGSFRMHIGGEEDIRGAYCAAVVARLTNVATLDMFEGTAEWTISCQTYEGGFGGQPGMEAHGGYSFCGYAALVLLEKEVLCDTQALLRWTVNRQMKFEGGFQGRTNKLVDGCYSFWQGAILPLIHRVMGKNGDTSLSASQWMFDQGALQEYVLLCCQYTNGGLVDKPGKPRDFYHTAYCLSGLSVAQHFYTNSSSQDSVLGDPSNELQEIHPVYNIGMISVLDATRHFVSLPVPNQK